MVRRLFGLILWVLILSAACLPQRATADTIWLKNGRSLEGIIQSQDERTVILEVGIDSTVTFDRGQVERIVPSLPQDHEQLRGQWQRQKIQLQDRLARQKQEEEEQPKKIIFSLEDEGIKVTARLNNRTDASLIIDTGASMVMLRKYMAEKLNIDLEKVPKDIDLQMADGRKVKAKFLKLASIRIQDVEAEDVDTAILLEEVSEIKMGDGLLGMSFLKRFNMKIDHKEKRLILERL